MKQILTALTLGLALASPGLAQNAAEIDRVRAGQSCTGCNLFQADLSYRNLPGIDVSGSRLRQSDLSLATMNRARFVRTDLSIANLFGGRFTGASFAGANLERATLVGAYFGSADFTGANLTGANISGAEMTRVRGLTQAQLSTACGDGSTRLPAGLSVPSCLPHR
ncbi:MAG: pentapeptide repeat-containing protein [Caulobacterales bacterium]|uniref:pentapeptide repeat-containing protein n=1 Tax=Glycocaulis sp. TaxID=1969725 RepID=UPI003FA12A18